MGVLRSGAENVTWTHDGEAPAWAAARLAAIGFGGDVRSAAPAASSGVVDETRRRGSASRVWVRAIILPFHDAEN